MREDVGRVYQFRRLSWIQSLSAIFRPPRSTATPASSSDLELRSASCCPRNCWCLKAPEFGSRKSGTGLGTGKDLERRWRTGGGLLSAARLAPLGPPYGRFRASSQSRWPDGGEGRIRTPASDNKYP